MLKGSYALKFNLAEYNIRENISHTTYVLVRRRVDKSEDVNCLSVAGRDEVCIVSAERQAVDMDEPDGGRKEVANLIWQFSPLHVLKNEWFGMGSPSSHGTCTCVSHGLCTCSVHASTCIDLSPLHSSSELH